jgi:hypothetical protein
MARCTRLLPLVGALALAGCAHIPLLSIAGQTLGFGLPDYPVTRADVDLSPYAFIAVRLGRAPRATLALAYYDGADRQWMAGNEVMLVTREGRLVRTVGLPEDLGGTTGLAGSDPLAAGLHRLKDEAGPMVKYVDLPGRNQYGTAVTLRYVREGEEAIEILEQTHQTVRVREEFTAGKWTGTNLYWADATTGFVWKSVQHVAPDLPPLEIEVLKPPA